jgi:hypothetical protein
MKRIYKLILFYVPVFSLFFACSKGNNSQPPATPTNLVYTTQVMGVTGATPNGDGSGKVNLTLSGKNVTSYVISLPTENKSFSVNGSSGTVNCVFTSSSETTTQYPINISAYCNTVKVDTTLYVTVYVGKPADPGTVLLWSDEFDGTSLNTNTWNFETGNNNGWGNNEKQYYTNDAANVSVKDGYLQIAAINSPNYNNSGFDYTSARITTQDKYSFTYGRVEMRAKIPGDPGTWPALWMLGSNFKTVGWPKCGEIDIMEAATNTWGLDVVGSSLHWGGDTNQKTKLSGATTDFHTYSMDWRADHLSFFVDGKQFATWTNDSGKPFNQNFFFIFNVAVGGNMGGNTINLGSGSTMYVDYVRVYN